MQACSEGLGKGFLWAENIRENYYFNVVEEMIMRVFIFPSRLA